MDRAKLQEISPSVETRDLDKLSSQTNNNVYQSVVVISKRAEQVGAKLRGELQAKLDEFASYSDNIEEINENREQIEISKFYERMPSSTQIAINEFENGELKYK